jgi:hypothetical protein
VSGVLPKTLDPEALYRSPSGRLCRVQSVDREGTEAVARLEYTQANGAPAPTNMPDGFVLRRENWRILKRVG